MVTRVRSDPHAFFRVLPPIRRFVIQSRLAPPWWTRTINCSVSLGGLSSLIRSHSEIQCP